MQKINYVPRERVLYWINHYGQFTQIPCGLDWGMVQDPQELIDAVNALKRTSDDMIDMSRLAQCFQSLHTSKLSVNANRVLFALWFLVKAETVRRHKSETKVMEKYGFQTKPI